MYSKRIFRTLGMLVFAVTLAACSDSVPAAKSACPESAQQYWKQFRSAVLKNDLAAITGMTHFPLEVRGELDDSPKKMVPRQDFNKHFPQLLNTETELVHNSQQPATTSAHSSMKELINVTTKLHSSFCSTDGEQFGVGEWIFVLRPKGWGFVQAFTNEL